MQREVDIKGFSFETISVIINYIYSGTLDMADEDIGNVLLAANMFQMENLEKICFDIIIRDMDPVKAISVFHFCRPHGSVFGDLEMTSKSSIL